MIVVAGEIFIPAEKRTAALEATKPLQQAPRVEEPGCHAYVFSADPCRDDVIVVFELWEDADSLATHFLHQNYFDMRAKLGEMGITGATTAKYRVDATAPVYNADHLATVEF